MPKDVGKSTELQRNPHDGGLIWDDIQAHYAANNAEHKNHCDICRMYEFIKSGTSPASSMAAHKAVISELVSRLAYAEACFIAIDKKITPEHAFLDPEATNAIMTVIHKAQDNAFKGCPEVNVLEVVSLVDKPKAAYAQFRQILAHWAGDKVNGSA